MEESLQQLTELLELKDTISEEEWKKRLSAEDYENEAELEADIKKTEKEVNKRRKKEGVEGEDVEERIRAA